MPTEAELIHYRDKKRNNLQQIKIKALNEKVAELEKDKNFAIVALDEGVKVEVEEVGSVKAHEIYKALGTQAVLPIVAIGGGYYIELSEGRYQELVGDG